MRRRATHSTRFWLIPMRASTWVPESAFFVGITLNRPMTWDPAISLEGPILKPFVPFVVIGCRLGSVRFAPSITKVSICFPQPESDPERANNRMRVFRAVIMASYRHASLTSAVWLKAGTVAVAGDPLVPGGARSIVKAKDGIGFAIALAIGHAER